MDEKEKGNKELLDEYFALARALGEHRKKLLRRIGVMSDPGLTWLEEDSIAAGAVLGGSVFGVDGYPERRADAEVRMLRRLNRTYPQGSRRNTQSTARGKKALAPERQSGRPRQDAQVRINRATPTH